VWFLKTVRCEVERWAMDEDDEAMAKVDVEEEGWRVVTTKTQRRARAR
jgi:hypothetical protein